MKEFDQCPGCQEDLLLAHSKNESNELSCLGCGYTCQATEASPDPALVGKINANSDYWQRRCEAAENIIEAINANDDETHATAYQAWLAIKASGGQA